LISFLPQQIVFFSHTPEINFSLKKKKKATAETTKEKEILSQAGERR
jgi:hypothetical protein